ncbi:hypothetical protein GCM10020295_01540 [Streptomyces cinereospinus]
MKAVPRPTPSSSSAGSMREEYDEPGSIWVSGIRPAAATRNPGAISSRGGKRVIRRAPIWVEPTTMATVIGRKARPDLTGL